MSLDYAKYRLTEWGKWSRDPPALRSNAYLWFGVSARSQSMPSHIEEIDGIVRRLEAQPRIVTIVHYCRQGHWTEKARAVDLQKSRYYQLLDEATWFVHTELNYSAGALNDRNGSAIHGAS